VSRANVLNATPHLPVLRLLNGIIGRLGIKHARISTQSAEKTRFVALASGFDANKFYIWRRFERSAFKLFFRLYLTNSKAAFGRH
jgi:hypothetical protein